jgi:predicted dithiol-disulfide oxidoreductase (DUF899 family)
MAEATELAPAMELAEKNGVHFPNESAEYRGARAALLAEEIELRRQIERVAEMRRALPPGGAVAAYTLVGESGPVRFEKLFGDKQTLVVYSMMYGPQRTKPCPMCTAMLSNWAGSARSAQERFALAVVARSPIERLVALKKELGWHHLRMFSDMDGAYTRAYVNAEDADVPAINVFSRRDGTVRHFWSEEMGMATADPGQDPRGSSPVDALWTLIDFTPEGRDPKWYPSLPPEPLVAIGK